MGIVIKKKDHNFGSDADAGLEREQPSNSLVIKKGSLGIGNSPAAIQISGKEQAGLRRSSDRESTEEPSHESESDRKS
jgi:hypothetical protein